MNCSFCKKSQESVSFLITGNGVYICDECIETCLSIIFKNFRKNKKEEIEWIEASAIDIRDGKEYFARVNRNDFNKIETAYAAAKSRAYYLANRGIEDNKNIF